MHKTFDRWATAWFVVCLVLTAHVVDEVLNGSYGLYEDFGHVLMFFFPSVELPVFHRDVWYMNLAGALLVLFALTWWVRKGRGAMVAASYVLAAFATANGVLHLLAVAALGTLLPGAWTAPMLVAAGLYLFIAIPKGQRNGAAA